MAADGWIVAERLRQWLLAPTPRQRIVAAAVALFAIACLFYFGAQDGSIAAIAAPWDKPAHVAMYFALGLTVSAALGGRRSVVVLALCALVGGTDEMAQLLVSGPDVDLGGWIADIIGVSLALLVVHFLKTVSPESGLAPGALSRR